MTYCPAILFYGKGRSGWVWVQVVRANFEGGDLSRRSHSPTGKVNSCSSGSLNLPLLRCSFEVGGKFWYPERKILAAYKKD